MKRKRLFNREPKTLEEEYFHQIRPKLYQEHITHTQHGTRSGRSLAEHLDSVCQFVLTVSKIAEVPEQKRGCILAATAVHDLNKLDQDQRRVQTLARDRAFLEQQLERAQVSQFVKTEEDLELVRRLIERHSGHNTTDGMRFLPEDPNIKRWAAMLIGADLFDLGIDQATRIRKVENELTVALARETKLFEITLSEDRGYLTALLLAACEEVLNQYELHTLMGCVWSSRGHFLSLAIPFGKRTVFSGRTTFLKTETRPINGRTSFGTVAMYWTVSSHCCQFAEKG